MLAWGLSFFLVSVKPDKVHIVTGECGAACHGITCLHANTLFKVYLLNQACLNVLWQLLMSSFDC
jgi:hypothetical protein